MTPLAPLAPVPTAATTEGPRFLIADVSALTGVPPSQLRSWERAGLLSPLRSAGAVRLYTPADVAHVRLVTRSLVNRGRRGSVRRLAAHLAGGTVHPEPRDYAGLGLLDTPHPAPATAVDPPPSARADASQLDALRGAARRAPSGGAALEDGDDPTERAILDAMPSLVAVCDARGQLTYMNPALRSLLPAAVAGQSTETGKETVRPTALDALPLRWAALTGTQHRDVSVLLHGPDHAERRTLWTVTPLRGADGAPRGAVAVGRDSTEESARAQAQEDALTVAAHDLRSPLTTILGNVQLTQRTIAAWAQPADCPDGPAQDEAGPPRRLDLARLLRQLTVAETGTRELIQAMNTMLDSAAVAAGVLVSGLEPGGVDVTDLARRAVAHARTLSTRHRITLYEPEHPPLVAGDRMRLRQVLDNLLANALKYAPDGGPVDVRLSVVATLPTVEGRAHIAVAPALVPAAVPGSLDRGAPHTWVLLQVADRGLGIPVDAVPHVFDRYWRAGGATQFIRGTGLGLYTCRAIVAAHGGHIWVARTAVAPEPHTAAVQRAAHTAPPVAQAAPRAGWHGTVMALALPLVSLAAAEAPTVEAGVVETAPTHGPGGYFNKSEHAERTEE